MDYRDVLSKRRMVRNYLPDPVPEAALTRIVAAIHRAPSAGFSQGHRLLVITDKATRAAVAEIAEEPYYTTRGMPPWISRAPVHLVLGTCEDDYHRRYTQPDKLEKGAEITWPAPYWFVDAGALLMLIQLTAIDAGLASGFLTVRNAPAMRELLGIPAEIAIVGIVTVGYPAPEDGDVHERIRRRRKPLEAMVRFGHWDPPG